MHTTKWLPSTVGLALTILGLLCNNARAEWICFTLVYYNGVNFQCNCDADPGIQQCLPVAAMSRAAFMSCSQSSADPSATWYGKDGGCASVTKPTWLGAKYPCEPQISSGGLNACESALGTGYVTTVGVLVAPENAVAWLAAVNAYYGMVTQCTYCKIITCTPSVSPIKNYYRNVVQPTSLDSNNNPVYDFPSCDG